MRNTIVTFYNEKINPEVVKAQKDLFDHFGIPLQQVKPDVWLGHGKNVDGYIATHDVWDTFTLFDIDCIPLDPHIVGEGLTWCRDNNGLFSVAQRASHIPDSIVYASPAYISFTRETYDKLGRPTFDCTKRSDCAGELSHEAMRLGLPISLMYPYSVDTEKWDLDNGRRFGYGTNYANRIYHQFESRKNYTDRFIEVCHETIRKYS